METRTPRPRALLLPAAFALTCLVVTIAVYLAFGGSAPFAPEGYRVTIPLARANSIVPGSEVEIAGVAVGKVVSVTRAGGGANATLELQQRFAPVHAGASAIVRTKTLLGEGYIELAPGSRSAAAIPDGGRLAASRVRPDVALDEFASAFDSHTTTNVRALLGGLATAFAGRATSLSDTLGTAVPLSANLGSLLSTLARQNRTLGSLIRTSGTVMDALGRRQGALRAAVTAGDEVFAATSSRQRSLAATVGALAPLLVTLRRTSVRLQDASPSLEAAARSLLPDAALLTPALTQVIDAAPVFRRLFERLPATLRAGDRALPAVGAITSATRKGLEAFYPTSRELIPFMQMFGAYRRVVSILGNVGDALGGTAVGPGGVVSNYLPALPTFWNESVSGWVHKLPTNRQNPYPESPQALLETGEIGVLKSYDCRNVNNPLWLPPLGGAPPCLLQGPFKFNGVTAYYPRLRLAPP